MLNIKNSKNKFCICCNSKLKKKVINLPKFPVTEFYISCDEKVNHNYLVNQAYFYCDFSLLFYVQEQAYQELDFA